MVVESNSILKFILKFLPNKFHILSSNYCQLASKWRTFKKDENRMKKLLIEENAFNYEIFSFNKKI